MDFKEITLLRKSNKLNEAWAMAGEWLQKEPDNIWAKRAVGWVLFDFLKAKTDPPQPVAALKVMNQIAGLDIPAEELMLVAQIEWRLTILFKNLKLKKAFTSGFIKELNPLLQKLPSSDSEAHRALLSVALRIEEMTHWAGFMKWWGWHHFSGADVISVKNQNGIPMVPLAEQAFIATAKDAIRRLNELPSETKFEEIETLVETGEKLLAQNSQLIFVSYHLSSLLDALGKKEQALEIFLPFAKKKATEFWMWEQLAALMEDAHSQLICLVKAVSCKAPPQFKVKVREKLAAHLIKRGNYTQARQEIDEAKKQRDLNDWRLTANISNWLQSQWYLQHQTDSPSAEVLNYKQAIQQAEALLYGDVSDTVIVTDRVLDHTGWLWFVKEDHGPAKARLTPTTAGVEAGVALQVKMTFLRKVTNKHGATDEVYQIFTARELKKLPAERLREVSGTITVPAGKTFGTVEGVFVPAYLVQLSGLINGQRVSGRAIKALNPVNNRISWKMVHLIR